MNLAKPESNLIVEPSAPPAYTVGTLSYDRRGILRLFGWLLWGDFAFTFFENIFGRFMPIYLKDLHASNTLIGVMTGSIAGLVNVLFLPNISQWCDRFRSKLGRRIPFLLVIAPLTTLSLVLVGFAPELAGWLHLHITSVFVPGLTDSVFLLSLLCVFVVFFHFSNMVLVNAYSWLFRDVVPQAFMPRFIAWFRVVDTIASVLFLWLVFPTMIDHRREVFLWVGLFYLASFMLMCWKVKEGKYPDPEPLPSDHNILKTYGAYFRDCLSVPLYRNFFLVYVLVLLGSASGCAGPFLTLYARSSLGLQMDDIGSIFAYSALLAAAVYPTMGWLSEKFNVMRVTLCNLMFSLIGVIAAFLLVGDKQGWLIYTLVSTVPFIGWNLGYMAIFMNLFPEKYFGQFASGLNVFGCGGLILGNYLIGEFMDYAHSDYRMVFIWSAFFYAAALIPMLNVYRDWKKHGGPTNYVAPLPPHY